MSDDVLALEIDVALADRARRETWQSAMGDDPEWSNTLLRLVMDLV